MAALLALFVCVYGLSGAAVFSVFVDGLSSLIFSFYLPLSSQFVQYNPDFMRLDG